MVGLGLGLGNRGFSPRRLRPSLWLRANQGLCSDASVRFIKDCQLTLQIPEALQTGLNPGTRDFSFVTWFCVEWPSSSVSIVGKMGFDDNGYHIFCNDAGFLSVRFGDGVMASADSAAGAVPTWGSWQFLACTADRAGNLSVYLGDSETGVLTEVISLDISERRGNVAPNAPFMLGGPYPHSGGIQSPAFYSRLLSFSEIVWLFNAGVGRQYQDIGRSGTDGKNLMCELQSWWRTSASMGVRYDVHGCNHLLPYFGEMIRNGDFGSSPVSWTASGATLASVAGGQSGNCLRVTNSGSAAGFGHQLRTLVPDALHKLTFWHKNGTSTGKVMIGGWIAGDNIYSGLVLDDAEWTMYTVSFRAPAFGGSGYVKLAVAMGGSGQTTLFDQVSLVAEELPAASGIALGPATDIDYSLSLDGTNQYLSIADAASQQVFRGANKDFEIGACVSLNSVPNSAQWFGVIGKASGATASGIEYSLDVHNGAFRFVVSDGTTARAVASASIRVGQWYFVRGWHDSVAKTINIEVDRIAASVAHATGVQGTSADLNVGRTFGADSYCLAGRIAKAYFREGISTPAEADYMFELGSGRHWTELGMTGTDGAALTSGVIRCFLDAKSASALGSDASGNNNHFTAHGDPAQGPGPNYLEGLVSRWRNTAGVEYPAKAIPLNERPACVRAAINGLPAVRFDGLDNRFALPFTCDAAFAILIVVRLKTAPSSSTLLSAGFGGHGIQVTDNSTVTVEIGWGTPAAFTVADLGTAPHILTVTRDGQNNVRVRLDGVESAAGPQFMPGDFAPETLMLGTAADLPELLVVPTETSAIDVARLERYLARKYGLTA